MSFSLDIKKVAEAMKQDVDQVLRASALDLGGKIIKGTPVDNGTARNNWYTSIDSEPSVNKARQPNKSGSNAMRELEKEAGMFGMNKTFYMVNRTPYIIHLEEGTPKMRPFAMVRRALDNFESGIKRLLG